ncbi:MAG: glutaredoxin [Actinobacteria bacterium]|nr:glutaredoxin [Actinomycetota bacterium]
MPERGPRPRGDGVAVNFYTRPGCVFSFSLRRRLHCMGIPLRVVDIRQDREAAASVRSVAGGCETVPTVAVGLRTAVNPPTDAVVRMIELEVPHLLPEGGGARLDWLRQLFGSSATKGR